MDKLNVSKFDKFLNGFVEVYEKERLILKGLLKKVYKNDETIDIFFLDGKISYQLAVLDFENIEKILEMEHGLKIVIK